MTAAGLALMTALAAPATVTAIRIETTGPLPIVQLDVVGGFEQPSVARIGREVVVTIRGAAPAPTLLVPPAVEPIESVRVEAVGDATRIRLRVRGDLMARLDRRPGGAVVRFEVAPAGESADDASDARRANIRELYAKILPPPLPLGEEAGAQVIPQDEPTARVEEEALRFGFLRFRPALVVSYIDADNAFLDNARPVRERYFQIEPHLGLGMGLEGDVTLLGARLRLSYEPRFRASTDVEVLRRPTHLAAASVTLPVGPAVTASVADDYANGLLETTQVDPGREYFFRFGRFVRNATTGRLQFSGSGRINAVTTFTHESSRIDDRAAFFDHERNVVSGDIGYLLSAALSAHLRVAHERVPTPAERPEAEANITTATVGVEGEVFPLVRADADFGYRTHDAPRAAEAGRRYAGLFVQTRIRKEFTPTSFVRLTGTRTTYLSAFEENGFYVTTGVAADGGMELPLYAVLHGAVSWQQNSYRVPAQEIGRPRQDRLWSWSLGIGRSVTRWGYARVDYRRDVRDSNLAEFRTRGGALVVQLGIGFMGRGDQP